MPVMRDVLVQFNGKVGYLGVEEKQPSWYDDIYQNEPMYRRDAEDSQYFPVWLKIYGKIGTNEKVADFGCGTGQLGKMMIQGGIDFVLGVDFSPSAIEMAKYKNPSHRDKFVIGDIYKQSTYEIVLFDCAIFSEVFEHLERDLIPIHCLSEGTHIIFTVPNYYTDSHVRAFKDEDGVKDYYSKLVDIRSIESVMMNPKEDWKIWVVDGRKI